jgi:UDP-galactopyranose mutase
VGAGLAGATVAERLATKYGKQVLLIEQRNHIAGNCFDCHDSSGIMIQKYGPHIFHTSLQDVWDYLSQFTKWNNYVHRVLVNVCGMELYLPINLDTMDKLQGYRFTPEELQCYFDKKRIPMENVSNSRDVIVSQIGEELYDLFFKNYTKKQWGVYPDELDAEVTRRIPVRFNRDTRYFSDRYQGLPAEGFTPMVQKMLDHKNIRVLLNTDYKEVLDEISHEALIYTGPLDYFFDYRYGKLPYRSLEFKLETLDVEQYQNAAVVNFPNEYDYTRITEFKQFYAQKHHKTTLCYEYPKAEGDPYYPMPTAAARELSQKYHNDAQQLDRVFFAGRLAEYRYLNMDQVVASSLALADKICGQ